ncbi:MAG TPA: hypothetical protein VGN34_27890, partial [Ktedonobacteraceae bacterium]
LLRASNGLEGAIREDIYIILWKAEELIESNQGYSMEEFAPGCFLIGSDGGETSYGLDLRVNSVTYGYFLSRPFISPGWDEATILGKTVGEFITTLIGRDA